MKLRNDVVLRAEFDGCGTLFDYRNGSNYFLNRTGVLICSQLEKGEDATVAEILDAIVKNTQGSGDHLEDEVRAFIESLSQKELIVADSVL